jgi:alcohol dehydrogenase
MMADFAKARALLREFKGNTYISGPGVLPLVGGVAALQGRRGALVRDVFPGSDVFVDTIRRSVETAGVELVAEIDGAGPNAPREDLFRIADALKEADPEVILSFGGGSTIDATKAGEVLRTLGGTIDGYFGTGLVTEAARAAGKALTAHVAIQTAASSGAHLTKYSNITDVSTGQKKLIVDEGIVPSRPFFDYAVTYGAPPSLTADGALDGIAHALEVLYGAVGKPFYAKAAEIAETGIGLVVNYLEDAIEHPRGEEARTALGLATDLGAYAIMIGGTNGGHLTSFSLVDVTSHGRACAVMNPYYTVFFAPAIEPALRIVGKVYADAGLTDADLDALSGRALGEAVAEAMFELSRRIGYPITLSDLPGFTEGHIDRALQAAKDPQLRMKLENMPIPMTADMIDPYMGPVLEAAKTGDVGRIVIP